MRGQAGVTAKLALRDKLQEAGRLDGQALSTLTGDAVDGQGEGLGRAMWSVMHAENPSLVWRSRRHNDVNDFYFSNADGALKDAEWVVFWYGMEDLGAIGAAVDRALARPATILR